MTTNQRTVFADPPIAVLLFSDPRLAWLWLPLRLWLGWQWLSSGLEKLEDPKWTQTGEALLGFWKRAVVVPESGRPAVAYDWYRGFLQMLLDGGHQVWFAKLVTFGELAIGVALILGAFTGIAAFFGLFMNWHFVMAGAASTNAMLMAVAMLLVLAWKTAGWFGLDRVLLPAVGTPWQAGSLLPRRGGKPAGMPQDRPAPG